MTERITAYLDTCIVSGLAKEDLSPNEHSALLWLLDQHASGKIIFVTSALTKKEIERIPATYRGEHEMVYRILSEIPLTVSRGADPGLMTMGVGGGWRDLFPLDRIKRILPGSADALHIFQSIKNKIDYFMTVDRRSILKFRDKLRVYGVVTVSPSELQALLMKDQNV